MQTSATLRAGIAASLIGGGALLAQGCAEPAQRDCAIEIVNGSAVVKCPDGTKTTLPTTPPVSCALPGEDAAAPKACPTTPSPSFDASTDAARPRRHVILMIGDGMGYAHQVAASRYRYGSDRCLSFQGFPVQALVTTWSVTAYDVHAAAARSAPSYSRLAYDPILGYDPARGGYAPYPLLPDAPGVEDYFLSADAYTDSAAAATAMATGTKTANAVLAKDPDGQPLETTVERLRRVYGMAAGLVTTVGISDATPAGFVAHAEDRGSHFDIAHQMLMAQPEVAIGAGFPPGDSDSGGSGWIAQEDVDTLKNSPDYVYVERTNDRDGGQALIEASAAAVQKHKKLWGLFGKDSYYGFDGPVAVDSPGVPRVERASTLDPTLPQAAVAAMDVLAQNEAGFFLMIEQGAIDKHSHHGELGAVVGCVWELDDTVKAVVDYVDRPGDPIDWSNTTVLVVADHETGFLRFAGPAFGIGQLTDEHGSYSWGWGNHTNQLITLSAIGAYAHRVGAYANAYGGRPILDNTAIFALALDAAER